MEYLVMAIVGALVVSGGVVLGYNLRGAVNKQLNSPQVNKERQPRRYFYHSCADSVGGLQIVFNDIPSQARLITVLHVDATWWAIYEFKGK